MTAARPQDAAVRDTGQRHIVVLGLRRSGTTALWEVLRQDPQHICYDEPLSPLLELLPANNAKGTWDEFIARRARDPAGWAVQFAPVPRGEELTPQLTLAQGRYLRHLCADGPAVIDETRATGKLAPLRAVIGPAVFVHLYRHPVAFASSHMIASQNPRFLRQRLHRLGLFRRWFYFDAWGMESFWRAPLRDATTALLRREGIIAPAPRAPAIQKLLALWLMSFRRLERQGPRLCGEGFVSMSFEAFCADPIRHLGALYARACRAPFSFEVGSIHTAARGYRPDDPRWRAAAEAVGFSEAELARFFPPMGGSA